MNTASHVTKAELRVETRVKDAWTAFWADHEQSRCAAGAPEIWLALTNHWTTFARSLGQGTPVLDLGCGAAVVGRLLLGARSDLHITGIDSAMIPTATHPRLAVLSHTPMEALPFPDRRFGAAVSQFGFEYSQTGAAARDVARVVVPGAALSFLVHHAESAIVAATRSRLNATNLFLAPAMCTAFCSGDAAVFRSRMMELIAKHPHDTLIAHLARALPARMASPETTRVAIWAAIEEALEPERCVSESLSECCVQDSQVDEWLGPLRSAFNLLPVTVLREPNGDPIAWRVEGVRTS
jgi:ubiquinone/menaquinone biosynthesis C-methylase UbiE